MERKPWRWKVKYLILFLWIFLFSCKAHQTDDNQGQSTEKAAVVTAAALQHWIQGGVSMSNQSPDK